MTALSDTYLSEIEARLNAATPGPWANTDNVQELFGHIAHDWWKVYARKKENSSLPSMVVCSMSHRATEEEMNQARKVSWEDESKIYDPGEAAHDARFIAHAPADIAALIAEVRRLKREATDAEERIRELESLLHASTEETRQCFSTLYCVVNTIIPKLKKDLEASEARAEKAERERDVLARLAVKENSCLMRDGTPACRFERGSVVDGICAECWLEWAAHQTT